jgi:hypothetical protein
MATKPKPAANKAAASAADLLSQLNDLTPTTTKPKASGKQKWELVLVGEDAVKLERWVKAKMVSDLTEARLENAKDEFSEYALDVIAKAMWKSKTRPANPVFICKVGNTPDFQAVFLFTDKFKYRFPEIPDDVVPRNHLIQTLVDLGLEEGDAARLVDTELDLKPVVGIRPLSELLQGRYGEKRAWIEATAEEQEAGRKLMAFLTAQPDNDGQCTVEALTVEERGLVIKRDPGIKVKADFYARVCSYCHSVEQLKAIFKVIVPIAYPTHQKFGINDSPETLAKRLVNAAADIIGVSVVQEKGDE